MKTLCSLRRLATVLALLAVSVVIARAAEALAPRKGDR